MSVTLSLPAAPPAHWRLPLAALSALLVLLLWQYHSTFSAMVGIWRTSDTFAHAFLVPPIALWLIWRQRERLARLNPQPQLWMLLPVALCGFGWLVGEVAGVNAITQLAVTALLVLTVPMLLGWSVAWAVAFPLGFLFFMVPIGEFVMPLMMEWTADVTVFTLRLIGIPVYREGLQFIIPTGAWSVVEACSGVRYLIASFMVGTLFAYLNYTSHKRRWAFVLFSLVVPIVANWGRAVMIVLLGHYSGNTLAVGVDHLVYGWVFFGIVIGIMFMVGARWAEPEIALPPISQAVSGVGSPGWTRAQWWTLLPLMLLVFSGPALLAAQFQGAAVNMPAVRLPALQGVTAAVDNAQPLHAPLFQNPRAQDSRVYGEPSNAVTVHVAYYRQQTFGRKLVNSQNVLVSSEDETWRVASRGASSVMVAGQPVGLRTAELRSGGLRGVDQHELKVLQVRQVFWVNGRLTTSNHMAALLGVAGQLSGRGDDAAALTFYIAGVGPDANAELDSFVSAQLGPLSSWLDSIRVSR